MTALPAIDFVTRATVVDDLAAALEAEDANRAAIRQARADWKKAARLAMRAAVGPEAAVQLYREACAKAEELAGLAEKAAPSDEHQAKDWFLSALEFASDASRWCRMQGAAGKLRDADAAYAWGEGLRAQARISSW